MRRCLHSLLVGVLTFSLAVDVASACGRLRSCRPCPPRCPPAVVVPCGVAWDACGVRAAAVVDVCGWSSACGPVVTVASGWEEIACGAPLDCCGGALVMAAPAAVTESAPTVESVVVPPAAPTAPVVVAPAPAGGVVPDLKPVEPVAPASATEEATETTPARESVLTIPPAGESADAPAARGPDAAEPETEPEMEEEPGVVVEPEAPADPSSLPETEPAADAAEPAAPAETPEPAPEPTPEPAPQKRPNIFDEEVEETEEPAAAEPVDPAPLDEPAVDGAAAGDEEMPDVAVEPDAVDPLPEIEPFLDDPLAEPVPADEPAAEPVDEPVDPAPLDEPEAAAAEPMRRWIDATASSAAVGRLVAVHADSVEILRADGRSVRVPLARLSAFDRDYCAEAGERLVAARGAGPQPGDTAGL